MPASTASDRIVAKTLRLDGVALDRRDGAGRSFRVLDIPELVVPGGAQLGLRGASGSGKTSLLHLIAGLLPPDRGAVRWGEIDVAALPAGAKDGWRRRTIGFVFQEFHLVPELDVETNILLPASFSRWRIEPTLRARAQALAARMGLRDLRRRARLLSRGEQQRAAIARALLHRPALILADEPTASLDRAQADAVGALLVEMASESGATLICATHDEGLLVRLGRHLELDATHLAAAIA